MLEIYCSFHRPSKWDNVMPKKVAISFYVALLASFSNTAVADDAQASRYLYCANVVQFYYQYLLKHEPNSEQVSTYRLTRDNFRLAATASKKYESPQSLNAENDAALQKVIAILEREKVEGSDLMNLESRSCADVMVKEVVPLLKSRSGQHR